MSHAVESPISPVPMSAKADAAILRTQGLRKTFRMGDSTVEVLKHVDLTIKPGEFVAIEGRSGSGKSTLLHILGALDAVDSGHIEFSGREYTRYTPAERTVAPGDAARSTPRCPASQGCGGGSKRRTTCGGDTGHW